MKNLITKAFLAVVLCSCSSGEHPNYQKNLAIAQKYFALHEEESLEEQMALISKDIVHESPLYNGSQSRYEGVRAILNGYHQSFEDIQFTALNWLPGTDSLGKPDGSVRTYGKWTGTHAVTGKKLNLSSYHYFNFNKEGLINGAGDFFDATGMLNAVYPKNLVIVALKIGEGNKEKIMEIMNSHMGLPFTRKFDGCLSLEMTYNEESNTLHLVENWTSYDKYAAYLKFRQEDDTTLASIIPLLKGGEKGLVISFPNSDYYSF
jgi:quinol monooxygenase YgiN